VRVLSCKNKFGEAVKLHPELVHAPANLEPEKASEAFRVNWQNTLIHAYDDGGSLTAWNDIQLQLPSMDWNELAWGFDWIADFGPGADGGFARETLTCETAAQIPAARSGHRCWRW
jgi:hypothetical protein